MLRPNVRDVAQGKWPAILTKFGLTERHLSGRHGPCPVCGGHDRFRFDDQEGRGTWFCSHCGAGDGIRLVMTLKDWDFKTAAKEIEQEAGVARPGRKAPVQDETVKVDNLRRAWSEARPLRAGDEAARYLAGRGLILERSPDCLRLHPGMTYREAGVSMGKYPALLARVVAADGTGLTLHRTYLLDGKKAPVPSAKKLMPGKPISGGAVRLFPPAGHLGIAEGIETALAASIRFAVPVWSCISAHGVETFVPPAGCDQITIFADNDANYTGQKAAFATAHRLSVRGIHVDVKIPDASGDWLDVLVTSGK